MLLLLLAAGLQADVPASSASTAPLSPAGHNASDSSGSAGRVLTDFPRLMTDQVRYLAALLRISQKQGKQLTEEQQQVMLFDELLEQVQHGVTPSPAHAQLLRGHWQMETECKQRQLQALRGIPGTEADCAALERKMAARGVSGGG